MEQKYTPHKIEGYEGATRILEEEPESIEILTPESILESYSSLEDLCSITQDGFWQWDNWDRWDRKSWSHVRR